MRGCRRFRRGTKIGKGQMGSALMGSPRYGTRKGTNGFSSVQGAWRQTAHWHVFRFLPLFFFALQCSVQFSSWTNGVSTKMGHCKFYVFDRGTFLGTNLSNICQHLSTLRTFFPNVSNSLLLQRPH